MISSSLVQILTSGRNQWKKKILQIPIPLSVQILWHFKFLRKPLIFQFSAMFLNLRTIFFFYFPVVVSIGQFLSSWYSQGALRNWENQTFRFPWENFMGVWKSEKIPKFNQKSTILKIFGFLNCYFRVMAISKCLINENLEVLWVEFKN